MEWMAKTMPLDTVVQMASNIRNTRRGMLPGMAGLKMEVELSLLTPSSEGSWAEGLEAKP